VKPTREHPHPGGPELRIEDVNVGKAFCLASAEGSVRTTECGDVLLHQAALYVSMTIPSRRPVDGELERAILPRPRAALAAAQDDRVAISR
jgi:hypothetical protein